MPNEEDYPLDAYEEDEEDEAPWFLDDAEDYENFFAYTNVHRSPKGPCTAIRYI